MKESTTLTPMGERAEHGMEQAAEHAERVAAGWKDEALDCVSYFARTACNGEPFIAEDVISWAERRWPFTLRAPDQRAWGAVMKRAQREGLVRADGFRRDKWGSVKTVWRGVAR